MNRVLAPIVAIILAIVVAHGLHGAIVQGQAQAISEDNCVAELVAMGFERIDIETASGKCLLTYP